MQPFEIFKIPSEKLPFFKENLVKISCDYRRFSFWFKDTFLDVVNTYFPWYWKIDQDNSNVLYLHEGSLHSVGSNRWRAFIYSVAYEWIWPVPLIYIELYNEKSKLPSVGRLDFYGSFFHFFDNVPDFLLDLYNFLDTNAFLASSFIRCTRTDIAFDFIVPFPADWLYYYKPSKNAKKRKVNPYYDYTTWEPVLNSTSYLTKKNSWYGVRMYNKILDIRDKNKSSWYTDLPDNLTRIEYELYPPYSSNFAYKKLENIISEKLFGSIVSPLGLEFRPNYWFKIENAYHYFKRYAKSKWIDFLDMLHQLKDYHLKFIWQEDYKK